MTYDAVVAGAGPAGTMSARILASRGYGIKVLEDDPVSGKPVQCAGLVSERVLGMSGVKPEVFGRFYGAEVIFPDGSSVIARSRNVKAVAIDRGDFDRRMADAAADAGAEFSYGSKYLSHESGGDGVSVISASGTDRCRAVIGADGYGSRVARSLSGNLPREYVYGAQYDLKNKAGSQDIFRVRMGNGCAPGFFLWEIPCGDFTRVGLCVSAGKGYPFGYLNAMVRKFYPDSGIIARYGGKIPLGGRRTTYGERCLLIGDAAGQVKPVSGGGIYPSLVSAGILADVLSDALDSGDLSAGRLSRYEKLWKAELGREMKFGYYLRKKFTAMDDSDINRAGRYSRRGDVRPALDEIDLDRSSDVVRAILRKPSAWPGALNLYLRSLF